MYEAFVQYKELIMAFGTFAVIIFSVLALMSAWMFQGTSERTLTGPLYSTYITIAISAMSAIFANFMVYIGDKLLMAFGLALFAFILLVLFTVSILCFAASNYSKSKSSMPLNLFGRKC
jgi:hypothetical protein